MPEVKAPANHAPNCHLWRNVPHSNLQKCSACGAVRVDPKERQAELQESAQMNRGSQQ